MENRDTFGLDAEGYRQYRPQYPQGLFRFLAQLAPAADRALDCATGNGQAAIDLATYFGEVIAVDTSAAQIKAAVTHPRVRYRVASAEDLSLPDRSVALIAVAQAAHWFDLQRFYREVNRVGRPGAVIAIWGYTYCRVSDAIDAIVNSVLLKPIESHWASGNKVILERYRSIDFPFDEIEWPGFASSRLWTRLDYMQYLRTWSATRKYQQRHGVDIVAELDARLIAVWPDAQPHPVQFRFVGRVGRIG